LTPSNETASVRDLKWREPSDPELLGRAVIGRAVRKFRLANGWSQQQLSWLVGVHQTTISRLEAGTISGMRFSRLARILGQLSVSPDALLDDGPPPPSRRLPGMPAR
jgi:transcriptional regulator with XRE-family HTH domain